MDALLKALAEPRRREILRLVREDELTAGEIAARFDVTRPAISQHLTVLEKSGLVVVRRDGTRRWYRTRAEALDPVLRFVEEFWTDKLQRLKVAAEAEAKAERKRKRGPKR